MQMMKMFFDKDRFVTGIILGLVSTSLLYFAMGFGLDAVGNVPQWLSNPRTPFLIALIPNVFLFRYFMVNRKQDKIGRGLLLVLFVVVFLVFLLIK